jgi:hypothetical protein
MVIGTTLLSETIFMAQNARIFLTCNFYFSGDITAINSIQNFVQYSSLKVKSIHKIIWIISVGFDVTDQLLIRSFAFIRYCRKKQE